MLLLVADKKMDHIRSHAMRRTFVILSLRADMDVLHLQTILGHESLEMTRHYAQMVDGTFCRHTANIAQLIIYQNWDSDSAGDLMKLVTV